VRLSSLSLLVAASLSVRAHAQAPVYRPAPDTAYVTHVNPYRMYWVRGTDTVGQPVREIGVEKQTWRSTAGQLSAVVQQLTLNVTRQRRTDTITIAPSGRVLLINGKPPAVQSRTDFLLRLPAKPLTPGTTWADTLDHHSTGVIDHAYRVERSYRVRGPVDSIGRKLVRVDASGTVRYQDGWWADSSRGTRMWLDVSGPVTESFLFDPAAGQLVARSWEMDLRGRGSLPNEVGGQDTLPAGLHSSEEQTLISAELGRLVMRELPVGDTSMTVNQGAILLHTVRRSADAVESGFARNDGLLGVARASFANGLPVRYAAQWTEGVAPATERRVDRRGDSLVIRGGGADSVVAIPTERWGIADYAMEESLVPVLLAMPADSAPHPFAVWRPFARHWDAGLVAIQPVTGGRIVAMRLGNDEKPSLLLITDDGDYLSGSNSGPTGAERVPSPGSARRATLEAWLAKLQKR